MKLLVLLIALAWSSAAYAWGGDGHRIICAIAWDELAPEARARVQELLTITSRDEFAESCTWADDYRRSHPATSGWHFVDVPPESKSIDLERDCDGPQSCVVAQIAAAEQGLTRQERGLDRANALRFLSHFVGDVHQPLHVAVVGDQGGNSIKGTFFKKKTNLHAIWDSGILAHDGRSWQKIAADLEASIKPDLRRRWTNSAPLDWADESLEITLSSSTRYLNHDDYFTLGAAYEDRNLPVVLERLRRAGVRLGALLNQLLAD